MLSSASASSSSASREEMMNLNSIIDGTVSKLGMFFPPGVSQLRKFEYFFNNLKHYFLCISRASGLVPLEDYADETGKAADGTIIKDLQRTVTNGWSENVEIGDVFFDLWNEIGEDMSILDEITEDVKRKIRSYSGKIDVDFPDIKDYSYSKEFIYVSEMEDTELFRFLTNKGRRYPSYSNRIELVFKVLGYVLGAISLDPIIP